MPNRETQLLQQIRLDVGSRDDVRLFRNNCGKLPDPNSGVWVQFGLCPGSSDLIGWRSVRVTPAMVGQRVAVFVAIEVKTPTGSVRPEQQVFLDAVAKAGGLAGVARDVAGALEIVRE